jgi:hypothetical protein
MGTEASSWDGSATRGAHKLGKSTRSPWGTRTFGGSISTKKNQELLGTTSWCTKREMNNRMVCNMHGVFIF